MNGTLVRIFFKHEVDNYNAFETLVEALSEACHGGEFGEDEYLQTQIGKLSDEARAKTLVLIGNNAFWQFNPEFGQTGDDQFIICEVEYFIVPSHPCMKEIVEWATLLGAEKVQLEPGNYADENEIE